MSAKISTNPADAFDEKWRRTDTNISLPAGSDPGVMGSSTNVLGGDVKTVLYVEAKEDLDAALEAARVEQEQMCGYPLVVKHTSQMQLEKHIEVVATFAPAPRQE